MNWKKSRGEIGHNLGCFVYVPLAKLLLLWRWLGVQCRAFGREENDSEKAGWILLWKATHVIDEKGIMLEVHEGDIPLFLENLGNLNRAIIYVKVLFLLLKSEMSCMKDEVYFVLLDIAGYY